MRLRLQNIGIVSKADININGIAVITGENDSGKSTVGKVLYSIIRALNPNQETFDASRKNFVSKKFDELLSLLSRSKSSNENDSKIIKGIFDKNINRFFNVLSVDDYEENIDELLAEVDSSMKNHSSKTLQENLRRIINEIEERKNISIDSSQYINFEISEFLNLEFGNQIKNNFLPEKSLIEIKTNLDTATFNFENNNVKIDKIPIAFPYKDVIFIESPLYINEKKTGFNSNSLRDKKNYLNYKINKKNITKDIFNDNRDEINHFNKIITEIIKGDFGFDDKNRIVFKKNSVDFSMNSVATGIKTFGAIQLLIENNSLSSDTLLIIDEPEIHLHPMWQILYAEILVRLSKEFAIPLIITSHSPYFIEAIEIFSKKYNYEESVDFYFSEKSENNLYSKIFNVNNNLTKIYSTIAGASYTLRKINHELNN